MGRIVDDVRFCGLVSLDSGFCLESWNAYMVVDVLEHLPRCNDKIDHFPYCLRRFISDWL